MKIKTTDLESISLLLDGKPTEAAFPENLSDKHLYQISRDLLLCEMAFTTESIDTPPPLAAPLLLLFHMFFTESAKLSEKLTYDFPEERLQQWISRYMFYVERELIARILKIRRPNDSKELLKDVQAEVA